MKKIFFLLSLYLLCWFPLTANAIRMTSLYQINIPVISQQADLRKQAFHDALLQVLIRASGNSTIANEPSIIKQISNAEEFVDEYSYERHFTAPNFSWLLKVNFDADSVNRLLRNGHATVWGENRPLILFWVVNSLSAQGVQIETLGDDNGVANIIKQQADRRGLPIIFPLMDLSEMGRISFADIGSANFSVLLPAAKRYGSDFVLAGRIFHDGNGYHFAAIINLKQEQLKWDVAGQTLPKVLSDFMDRLANTLAARYASLMTEQAQSELQMTVIGIHESADIDKVLHYLGGLPPVVNIRIIQVNGGSVVLDLSLRGTLSAFSETISVDQHLELIENENQSTNSQVWQWKE